MIRTIKLSIFDLRFLFKFIGLVGCTLTCSNCYDDYSKCGSKWAVICMFMLAVQKYIVDLGYEYVVVERDVASWLGSQSHLQTHFRRCSGKVTLLGIFNQSITAG